MGNLKTFFFILTFVFSGLARANDVLSTVRDFRNFILTPDFGGQNTDLIISQMSQLALQIDRLNSEDYRPALNAEYGDALLREYWQLRLDLKDRLKNFVQQGRDTEEMLDAIRNLSHAMRESASYVGEASYVVPKIHDPHHEPVFNEIVSNLYLNPKFANRDNFIPCNETGLPGGDPSKRQLAKCGGDFQNGDVIISRDIRNMSSAAITQLPDQVGDFSHLSLIYKPAPDETDLDKIYAIYADAGSGLHVITLHEFLNQPLGRAMILRSPEFSTCVADGVHKEYLHALNDHVDYDFVMDDPTHRTVDCVESIEETYQSSCGVVLPLHRSLATLSKSERVRQFLGIKVTSVFTPEDLEFDPRFEIVADWTDFSGSGRIRKQAEIASKIFDWIGTKQLDFRPLVGVSVLSHLAKAFMLFLGGITDDGFQHHVAYFPKNIPIGMIEFDVMLQETGDSIFKPLTKVDNDHINKVGLSLTPFELRRAIEEYRDQSDLWGTYLYETNDDPDKP